MTICSKAIKTVLFDLDDTLTDHQRCSRSGLQALQQTYPCFAGAELVQLDRDNLAALNQVHVGVLAGKWTTREGQFEKFRILFDQYGHTASEDDVLDAVTRYRAAYEPALRPVPGAIELLEALRSRGLAIAVITNNIATQQRIKIRHCGLEALIDVLVISEEAGVQKPDREIFEIVLDQAGCTPHETVMVGDSWVSDILGARQLDIPCIWLNRYDMTCPDPSIASEIKSLEPTQSVVDLILKTPALYK